MATIREVANALREFERSGEVAKQVRQKLREPVPVVRKRIKATAVATLPHSGGLGAWVAGTKITAQVTLRGRAAGIRLKGGRNSLGGRSDTKAIDRGRLRHPSWGRRTRGNWHTQEVLPGFFTETATESDEWGTAIEEGLAIALRSLGA